MTLDDCKSKCSDTLSGARNIVNKLSCKAACTAGDVAGNVTKKKVCNQSCEKLSKNKTQKCITSCEAL